MDLRVFRHESSLPGERKVNPLLSLPTSSECLAYQRYSNTWPRPERRNRSFEVTPMRFVSLIAFTLSKATYYQSLTLGYATLLGFLNLLAFYSFKSGPVLFHTGSTYRVPYLALTAKSPVSYYYDLSLHAVKTSIVTLLPKTPRKISFRYTHASSFSTPRYWWQPGRNHNDLTEIAISHLLGFPFQGSTSIKLYEISPTLPLRCYGQHTSVYPNQP